jgi:3-hydroxyisobutyrate dehydrogenase
MGGSAVGSPFVKYKTAALVADDYRSTFTAELMYKDLGLILEAAEEVRVPLPLTAVTGQLVQSCIAVGMADWDLTALLPRLRRDAGIDEPPPSGV